VESILCLLNPWSHERRLKSVFHTSYLGCCQPHWCTRNGYACLWGLNVNNTSLVSEEPIHQSLLPSELSCPTVVYALLVQLTPSPPKPASQVHSKLPKVLSQVAFMWQLSISVSHSSISNKKEKAYVNIRYPTNL